jgi:hypothetical protein
MTLPRPVLIALLGVALIGAALLGMRGARSAGEDEGAAQSLPEQRAPARTPAATGLTSGRIDVRLSGRDLPGAAGQRFEVRLRGRFQGQGDAAVPRFELELSGRAPGARGSFAAISTGDAGYVRAGGTSYRVPAEGWSEVTAMRTRLAQLASGAAGSRTAPAALDPSAWLARPRTRPGPRLDGVATTRTTGTVDVRRMVRDLSRLTAAAGGAAPALRERDLARAVRRASVTYDVGTEDRILRRARVELLVRVPQRLRDEVGGLGGGRFAVAIDLSGVNEPQAITAPAGARELETPARGVELAASTTLLTAGAMTVDAPAGSDRIDPAALAAPAAGGGSATVPATAQAKPGEGLPRRVAAALARRDVVVIAFLSKGGDDRATREALRAVQGRRGVTVVVDGIGDVSDYRRVVGGLGINQAPAIAIVRRDGKGELLEGYVDAGTLAQEVVDAR